MSPISRVEFADNWCIAYLWGIILDDCHSDESGQMDMNARTFTKCTPLHY